MGYDQLKGLVTESESDRQHSQFTAVCLGRKIPNGFSELTVEQQFDLLSEQAAGLLSLANELVFSGIDKETMQSLTGKLSFPQICELFPFYRELKNRSISVFTQSDGCRKSICHGYCEDSPAFDKYPMLILSRIEEVVSEHLHFLVAQRDDLGNNVLSRLMWSINGGETEVKELLEAVWEKLGDQETETLFTRPIDCYRRGCKDLMLTNISMKICEKVPLFWLTMLKASPKMGVAFLSFSPYTNERNLLSYTLTSMQLTNKLSFVYNVINLIPNPVDALCLIFERKNAALFQVEQEGIETLFSTVVTMLLKIKANSESKLYSILIANQQFINCLLNYLVKFKEALSNNKAEILYESIIAEILLNISNDKSNSVLPSFFAGVVNDLSDTNSSGSLKNLLHVQTPLQKKVAAVISAFDDAQQDKRGGEMVEMLPLQRGDDARVEESTGSSLDI